MRYQPYPEITGYSASLFAKLFKVYEEKAYLKRSKLASDALLSLQLNNGAINSIADIDSPKVYLFDHGMIVNGLIDYYNVTHNEKYLRVALKGASFIAERQRPDGSLPVVCGHNQEQKSHFLLAKIIIPFVKLYYITSNEKLLETAERIALFTLKQYQRKDGWLGSSSNSPKVNRFHYLCYAVEGLIFLEKIRSSLFENIRKVGDYLFTSLRDDGAIGYSYSKDNRVTGKGVDLAATAQTIRILLFLYNKTRNRRYYLKSLKSMKHLILIQHESPFNLHNGGVPFGYLGEVIDWFASCTWATMFAIDAAMMCSTASSTGVSSFYPAF